VGTGYVFDGERLNLLICINDKCLVCTIMYNNKQYGFVFIIIDNIAINDNID